MTPPARDRYVYTLFMRLPGGTCLVPFYVGVGKLGTKRYLHHEREARYGSVRRLHEKHQFILDAIALGFEIYPQLETDNLTIDEACFREIVLIAHYGRRDIGTGCLFNRAAGGFGVKNLAPSTRIKVLAAARAANIGSKHAPERNKKIAAFHKGKPKTPESRAKLSASRKGMKFSAEHRANIGAANRKRTDPKFWLPMIELNCGRKLSPEHKEKLRALNVGKKMSEESKAKMRVSARGMDPDVRARIQEAAIVANYARVRSREHLARLSKGREASLDKIYSQECNAARSAALRGRKHSPERLANMAKGRLKARFNKLLATADSRAK